MKKSLFLFSGKSLKVKKVKSESDHFSRSNVCVQYTIASIFCVSLTAPSEFNASAYRRANCYDACLEEFANKSKLSLKEAFNSSQFHYGANCSELCPLRCTQKTYAVQERGLDIGYRQASHFLRLNFHYEDEKFAEISQAAKTSQADLVANAGGVLGLFLDVSFFHVYKALAFALDLAWAQLFA